MSSLNLSHKHPILPPLLRIPMSQTPVRYSWPVIYIFEAYVLTVLAVLRAALPPPSQNPSISSGWTAFLANHASLNVTNELEVHPSFARGEFADVHSGSCRKRKVLLDVIFVINFANFSLGLR